MLVLPDKVKATLDNLKKEYKFFVSLKKINNKYYLYRQTTAWNKEKKKLKVISTYLGRILDDGAFIKKEITKDDELENAKAIILAHGGKVVMSETNGPQNPIQSEDEYEDKILVALSTDGRRSVSDISKDLGLSYNATLSKIKKIEEKYEIKYTIEYGFLDKFNLQRYFAIAKFTDQIPDAEKLKTLFQNEKYVQLAVLSRGEYNLFLFILASNPTEAENVIYKLRSDPILSGFPSQWYVSYFTHGYEYIPLRDEFFDLIKDRVWQRTKESPRKLPGQIFYREYATMKELNANGLIDFVEIDKKYGLNRGSARHTYQELIKNENLWRITITMKNPPVKNAAMIVLEQTNISEFNKHRKEYFLHILESNSNLNKYLYTADIGAPYGILLIAPLYKEGDLEKIEIKLRDIVKDAKIHTSIATNVLVGGFGFRKVDNTKTLWYRSILPILNKNANSEN